MLPVKIEVTDLYDKLHSTMELVWNEAAFRGQAFPGKPIFGATWDEVVRFLEDNLFLAGCARRVYNQTGQVLGLEDICNNIKVCDLAGIPRNGPAGEYICTGFDWGKPDDERVENLVIAGDERGDLLKDVRLFVVLEVTSL